MKIIYEFPEVTVFEVGVVENIIAGSNFGLNDTKSDSKEEFTNSNSFDDQSTPWYRR